VLRNLLRAAWVLLSEFRKFDTSLFYRAIACLDRDVSSPEEGARTVAKFMHLHCGNPPPTDQVGNGETTGCGQGAA
jgi:hypothetical protein